MALLDSVTRAIIRLRYALSGPKAREHYELGLEFHVDPMHIAEMRQAYDPLYKSGQTILMFPAWVRFNFDKYDRGWPRV